MHRVFAEQSIDENSGTTRAQRIRELAVRDLASLKYPKHVREPGLRPVIDNATATADAKRIGAELGAIVAMQLVIQRSIALSDRLNASVYESWPTRPWNGGVRHHTRSQPHFLVQLLRDFVPVMNTIGRPRHISTRSAPDAQTQLNRFYISFVPWVSSVVTGAVVAGLPGAIGGHVAASVGNTFARERVVRNADTSFVRSLVATELAALAEAIDKNRQPDKNDFPLVPGEPDDIRAVRYESFVKAYRLEIGKLREYLAAPIEKGDDFSERTWTPAVERAAEATVTYVASRINSTEKHLVANARRGTPFHNGIKGASAYVDQFERLEQWNAAADAAQVVDDENLVRRIKIDVLTELSVGNGRGADIKRYLDHLTPGHNSDDAFRTALATECLLTLREAIDPFGQSSTTLFSRPFEEVVVNAPLMKQLETGFAALSGASPSRDPH
jgi:hypothetical protein